MKLVVFNTVYKYHSYLYYTRDSNRNKSLCGGHGFGIICGMDGGEPLTRVHELSEDLMSVDLMTLELSMSVCQCAVRCPAKVGKGNSSILFIFMQCYNFARPGFGQGVIVCVASLHAS